MSRKQRPLRVMFLGKNAARAGGQQVLGTALKFFDKKRIISMVLLPTGGPLLPDYERHAQTHVYESDRWMRTIRMSPLLKRKLVNRARRGWVQRKVDLFSPDVIVRWYHHRIEIFDSVSSLDLPKVQIAFARGASVAWLPDAKLRLMIEDTSLFLCEGFGSRRYIHDCWGVPEERIATVCIGIDEELAAWQLQKSRITRQSLKMNDNTIVIATCGSFVYVKGVDLWLRMAANLISRFSQLDLRFIWIGGTQAQFQSLYGMSMNNLVKKLGIEHKVTFLGEQKDVFPYLNLCDIYVQPSRDDAFPHAPLEAMTLSKPVVSSPQGIALEVYAQNNLVVVNGESSEALAEGVGMLIGNPDLQVRLGESGKELMREKLDVEDSVRQLENILIGIAG